VTVIAVRDLVKTFGTVRALDGLDLKVEPGEVHGFLGPNGAGKSTTIRVLLGMYGRTSGHVCVLGLDPAADPRAVTRRVAYVPGTVALWPRLTGRQVIEAVGGLRGARNPKREGELVAAYRLDPDKRIRDYSKGNLQKVALVAAFAADTPLLVLDEPTSGLDPLMEEVFQDCVRDAVARGRTILLSSHILGEVDRLCDRVTIIKDGRTVETGRLADLRHLSSSRITCLLANPVPGVAAAGEVDLAVAHDAVTPTLTRLLAAGATRLTCTPASLEDLFLRHYAGASSGGAR
jgi:ABC-2 type transport system ATP-binding protein